MTFDVDISNLGLRHDNYTVSVTVQDPEWDINHPSTVSNILSNSLKVLQYDSLKPKLAASVHQFNISVTSEGDVSRSSSVFVNIDVSQ